MLYAVLLFDHKGDHSIRQIWQALADEGIIHATFAMPIPPHITLAMLQAEPARDLSDRFQTFTNSLSPIPINMPYYGIFTAPQQVIFLGVTVTDALYHLHRTLYQQLTAYLNMETLFAPATWVPHSTLTNGLPIDKTATVLDICYRFPLPIFTTANRLALIESETGETMHEFAFSQ